MREIYTNPPEELPSQLASASEVTAVHRQAGQAGQANHTGQASYMTLGRPAYPFGSLAGAGCPEKFLNFAEQLFSSWCCFEHTFFLGL